MAGLYSRAIRARQDFFLLAAFAPTWLSRGYLAFIFVFSALIVFFFDAFEVVRAAAGAQGAERAEDDAQEDDGPGHVLIAPRG
jgi:hypothetical protein